MEKENNIILWEGQPIADGAKPLRKKIVQVAKMIGGPTGILNKIDGNAPEYYSLAGSITDEECDLLLAMGLRKLRLDYEIAKKLKWDVERVRRVVRHLGDEIGMFRYTVHDDGTLEFFLPIFAPGILEIMVVSPNADKHPEVRRAFNQYTHDRLATMATLIPQGYGLMRVIPIERALPKGEKPDPRDKISYYLDKYTSYSVGACSCRTCRTEMGEGCGHLADDRCVKLGKAATFFVNTGKDRPLTRQECEELLIHCEDLGLMHCIPNIEGIDEGNTTAICDCCGCACFGLRPAEEFRTNEAVASNYRCVIQTENCVACGKCVENCPVNAMKLGTKLPLVKEIHVKNARALSKTPFSKVGTNADYRYSRTEVVEETGTAPCKTWCPAHIGVQGYIQKASQGKYQEALELIKFENPFPAVCGRICNRACEQHCTRGCLDQAVAIDDIKKFIAELELDPKTRFIPQKMYDFHDKKIAIIGAGPAGLSCAYYLAINGYDITVYEKEEKLGGMMTLGIPAFRLGKDVVNAEIEVIKALGVKFVTGVEVGKDITIPELRKQGFAGFFLAIGAQKSRQLNVPHEDNDGTLGGIDFLRDVNLGHGKKLSGRVLVIGGGNVAMDVARTALRQGAEKVDLYCLEQRNEMPSSIDELQEAEEEGIIIHNGWGPQEFVLENGHLHALKFKKCVSVYNAEHRFSPVYDEKEIEVAEASFVLEAIGQSFDYGKLLEGTQVALSKRGTVIADPFTKQTNEPDIFVGGDILNGPSFCINAIADGKQAAVSLNRFVQPGQTLTAGRDHRNFLDHELNKENVDLSGFDKTPREIPSVRPINVHSYEDNRGIFTPEQIKKEASRCLKCGAVMVDPNLCVGCGQCVLQCKFDAAHLVKKTSIYAKDFSAMLPKALGHTIKRGIKIAANALKKD